MTVTDGVVPNSDPVTFTTAGTFFWQAVYSGDANNLAADQRVHDRGPGGEPECAVDHDDVVVVGAGGDRHRGARHVGVDGGDRDRGWDGDLHRVHQRHLYREPVPAGTMTVTNGVVPDSDPVTFTTAGTFYWQAAYSGDANNLPAKGVCTSEILIVNPAVASEILPVDPAVTSVNSGSGSLAFTGSDIGRMFLLGTLLVTAGLALLLLPQLRRRRREQ